VSLPIDSSVNLLRDPAAVNTYSLLASCELVAVNPVEYLADILPPLARGVVFARDIPKMTPAGWKTAHEAASALSPDE